MSRVPIRFFDITSKLRTKAWSPNTWKTRYVLNYKNLPYETHWLEYPDIASTCTQIGAQPTSTTKAGKPQYTLPVIQDVSRGVVVSDSFNIVEYLESAYPPSSPSHALIPPGTRGLQLAFLSAFRHRLGALWAFAIPQEVGIFNPRSEEYFRRTREVTFGVSRLEELRPVGKEAEVKWKKFEGDLGVIDSWWAGKDEIFFMGGERPRYPDFAVAAIMVWCRNIWGQESKEWRDISGWHGGRWGRLVEALKEYEHVK